MKNLFKIYLLLVALFLFTACAAQAPKPISLEDNPTHHYLQGMEALELNQLDTAEAKFDRALYLDEKYSPALVGKALAIASRSAAEPSNKNYSMDSAIKLLKKAKKYARTDSLKFITHVSAIRLYTQGHPDDWLAVAESHYHSATGLKNVNEAELPYYRDTNSAHHFMGVAYYKGYKFRPAEETLALAISGNPGKWHDTSDKLYKKIQKIVRASGHYTLTSVGNRIAVKDEVTRGDVAALLVDELHIDKLFAGRIPVQSNLPKEEFVPLDIKDHPLGTEIATVLKWQMRGLETRYDAKAKAQLFYPQEYVRRKEMAFILEDIVIKLTADNSIATAFVGTDTSPFPDVPADTPWFNAVMNVTIRGLMESDLSGEFHPELVVNGADLILSTMKLRNVMNIN